MLITGSCRVIWASRSWTSSKGAFIGGHLRNTRIRTLRGVAGGAFDLRRAVREFIDVLYNKIVKTDIGFGCVSCMPLR